jgi:hypothetical protein
MGESQPWLVNDFDVWSNFSWQRNMKEDKFIFEYHANAVEVSYSPFHLNYEKNCNAINIFIFKSESI